VIAGTGSNSTADAITHTRQAEEIGVDGALVVAPYYNKPSQEGLFRHFAAIAEATSLQLILYNIPGRCAVDISADTVIRLAQKFPNICAIKEASGSVDRVSELVRRAPPGFTVLSGDDSLTLPFLAVGAVGVVSVASNLFPAEISQLVSLFLEGKAEQARELHLKFFPLFKDLFIEPNPVPVKTILGWRGVMSPDCRLPLTRMSQPNEERLRRTFGELEKALA
jgi:4-hydroxy-tetrahydrodipicolinate synthase